MDPAFPCNQCGLCCQHIEGIEALHHLDNGHGRCIHLQDGRCVIYMNRPEVCRVDEMYMKYFAMEISWESFILENLKVCKQLQESHGVPEEKQVKLDAAT